MNPPESATPPADEQAPTRESLADVLTDRPLVRVPNRVRSEICQRCEEKNSDRMKYDRATRDPTFEDGERVILICVYNAEDEEYQGWRVTAAHHTDHPMKPKDEVSLPGQAQAQVTARLDREGWTYTQPPIGDEIEATEYHVEDRSVVREAEVDWFSPVEEGKEREPIREPNEHGTIELKPTDPRPSWPEEENAWRKTLMQEHGDWNDEIPTVHLDQQGVDGPDEPSI